MLLGLVLIIIFYCSSKGRIFWDFIFEKWDFLFGVDTFCWELFRGRVLGSVFSRTIGSWEIDFYFFGDKDIYYYYNSFYDFWVKIFRPTLLLLPILLLFILLCFPIEVWEFSVISWVLSNLDLFILYLERFVWLLDILEQSSPFQAGCCHTKCSLVFLLLLLLLFRGELSVRNLESWENLSIEMKFRWCFFYKPFWEW